MDDHLNYVYLISLMLLSSPRGLGNGVDQQFPNPVPWTSSLEHQQHFIY